MANKLQKAGMHVTDTLPAIITRMADRDVMTAIVRRTLSFGKKTSERLPCSFFEFGFRGKICIFPPCRKLGTFRNVRLRLEKRRLIFRDGNYYTPNAYGVLKVAKKIWPESKEIAVSLEHITEMFKKQRIPLQALANEDDIMANIDEMVKAGSKKFENAKKKRKLSVDWVLVYFRDAAKEHGLRVLEPESVTEKKKVRGCIRNWLKECKAKEVDPKEQLDKVIEYWESFADGELVHHETARQITLNDAVASWQQYYTYRIEIDEWLKNPYHKQFTPIPNIEDVFADEFNNPER